MIACNSSFTRFKSFSFRTSAYKAASYVLSGKISQPPNTISFRSTKGTISLISFSLPSCIRIVAICVIEPIAFVNPLRAANVPVIIVVETAPPTPTTKTPKRPFAGLISCFISSKFIKLCEFSEISPEYPPV